MLCPRLPTVFPKNNEKVKKLLSLLTKPTSIQSIKRVTPLAMKNRHVLRKKQKE
jgi:hypothetical protein